MTISITASAESALPTSPQKVKRRMARILSELGRQGEHVSILFTDDKGIRKLNWKFRRIDLPTNVLAFPDGDGALGLPGHLGDVALSTQTLFREAKALEADPGDYLYYYLIHAVLHLVGHDHEKGEAEERAQREETERLLDLIRRDL